MYIEGTISPANNEVKKAPGNCRSRSEQDNTEKKRQSQSSNYQAGRKFAPVFAFSNKKSSEASSGELPDNYIDNASQSEGMVKRSR